MFRLLNLVLLLLMIVPNTVFGQAWADKMFTKKNHKFGMVARAAKVEYRFKFKNLYKEDIQISHASVSCHCTSITIPKKLIKSREEGEIVALFNTTAFLGFRQATITVVITKPYYAEVRLHVQGEIRQDVVFSPGSINFGTVTQGEESVKNVTVNYAGRQDWKIKDITSANSNLEVELDETQRGGGRVSYKLKVKLKKSAPAGYIKDTLTVVTDDSRVKKIPLYIEGRVKAPIELTSTSLYLGVVEPGKKVTKLLEIKGKIPFKVSDVNCKDGCFKFKVSSSSKKTHRIPVTFTAGDKLGKVTETIKIKVGDSILECMATATVAKN